MSFFSSVVAQLSGGLAPFFGASATAAAIVVFTLCVRLALHPLARAAVRGERVRARLAPQLAELRGKHGGDPERLRRAVGELQAREGTSPVAGCLPMLLQLPVFFAMYYLFTRDGELLGETLLGAPLGGRWPDALDAGGLLGAQGLVYVGLFVLVAAVSTWTYVRTRRLAAEAAGSGGGSDSATAGRRAVPGRSGQAVPEVPGAAAMGRLLPLLSFGTLITVAVVPLAAALYVVTSTTWTAVERAALGAGRQPGGPAGGRTPERPAGRSSERSPGRTGGRRSRGASAVRRSTT
ncbi:YidC/Oxa1 family membrane protein insertase [Streptomyces sp. WMMB 714]|uniref:YidC/Oxa1 family membrane protein insertase n=1 Tax=Streptomyces sp. WMMB 714 TaxID=1286822 RepID=UPI00082394D3|nr:membrane protein insertase YidC [Streptomyces sp. WMMB 714]SCK54719.1 YidC/Oxa1 family membrane protein insertase [Streptomyces sp. WMMB 714]